MSVQELNGDIRLSAADRLRYLWRNACRWLGDIGRGPRTTPFLPRWSDCAHLFVGQSPSRLVTEAFLETLPQRLPTRPIEVLEIGCGSGSMALRLARLGYSGRYTGVDVDDRFARTEPANFAFERRFVQIDAHAFVPEKPLDLVISLSALEHIPRDEALIKRLDAFVAPNGMQVHIVPSGAALPLYLWHGWRQFTPAMLGARFGSDGTQIYRVGGLGSFLVHFLALTPEILVGSFLRKRAIGLYRAFVRGALILDRGLPFAPAAYIVVKRR